jgi:DNA-binding beta-propeller fold protein YncE
MVFTSDRGENTVGVFNHGEDHDLQKIKVGGRPNGLAFDHSRNVLLAANVPKPTSKNAVTVSIVDVAKKTMTADVAVPGRTRWGCLRS